MAGGGLTRLEGGWGVAVDLDPHTSDAIVSTLMLGLCSRMQQCLRYSDPRGGASDPGTSQCRHNTPFLGFGIAHTFFFLEDKTEQLCQREAVDLSQQCKMAASHRRQTTENCFFLVAHHAAACVDAVRTRPPFNLSTRDADEGGCRLSWSRPYPPSSPLSEDTVYQLDYRRARGDKWTVSLTGFFCCHTTKTAENIF